MASRQLVFAVGPGQPCHTDYTVYFYIKTWVLLGKCNVPIKAQSCHFPCVIMSTFVKSQTEKNVGEC